MSWEEFSKSPNFKIVYKDVLNSEEVINYSNRIKLGEKFLNIKFSNKPTKTRDDINEHIQKINIINNENSITVEEILPGKANIKTTIANIKKQIENEKVQFLQFGVDNDFEKWGDESFDEDDMSVSENIDINNNIDNNNVNNNIDNNVDIDDNNDEITIENKNNDNKINDNNSLIALGNKKMKKLKKVFNKDNESEPKNKKKSLGALFDSSDGEIDDEIDNKINDEIDNKIDDDLVINNNISNIDESTSYIDFINDDESNINNTSNINESTTYIDFINDINNDNNLNTSLEQSLQESTTNIMKNNNNIRVVDLIDEFF